MPLVPRPDRPTHETPAASFTSLATPSRGGSDVAVWEVHLRPGNPATVHQVTRAEVFVALEGRAVALLDGHRVPLGPTDVLVVPADTPFALETDHAQGFRALCTLPADGQARLPGAPPSTPPWAR
jgi:mannose-6-phosphate isomerase-like protein (cupin superfamily)